ncbi:MAG TPA: hypothetical protein VJZ75_04490 [Candidatus Bathyarchaeia archaeon]|nr:hypothetical protein [Candidatus Bathyarchaeia archaeon]
MIEDVFTRFSTLDRPDLLDKLPTIIRYLNQICMGGSRIRTNILLDIVSRVPPELDEALKRFEDPTVKAWLENLNRKYVGLYEGVFPPFPHDWYRVSWSTSFNTSYGIPFIAVKIIKRNGETVFLEQPLQAALRLISNYLRQIQAHLNKSKTSLQEDSLVELEQIRKLADVILKQHPSQLPKPLETRTVEVAGSTDSLQPKK